MTKTDDDVRCVADTYLIWAKLEKNFGNDTEFDRLVKLAHEQSKNIRHKEKNDEMNRLIEKSIKPAAWSIQFVNNMLFHTAITKP